MWLVFCGHGCLGFECAGEIFAGWTGRWKEQRGCPAHFAEVYWEAAPRIWLGSRERAASAGGFFVA